MLEEVCNASAMMANNLKVRLLGFFSALLAFSALSWLFKCLLGFAGCRRAKFNLKLPSRLVATRFPCCLRWCGGVRVRVGGCRVRRVWRGLVCAWVLLGASFLAAGLARRGVGGYLARRPERDVASGPRLCCAYTCSAIEHWHDSLRRLSQPERHGLSTAPCLLLPSPHSRTPVTLAAPCSVPCTARPLPAPGQGHLCVHAQGHHG